MTSTNFIILSKLQTMLKFVSLFIYLVMSSYVVIYLNSPIWFHNMYINIYVDAEKKIWKVIRVLKKWEKDWRSQSTTIGKTQMLNNRANFWGHITFSPHLFMFDVLHLWTHPIPITRPYTFKSHCFIFFLLTKYYYCLLLSLF